MKRCPAVHCADSFVLPGECCRQCPGHTAALTPQSRHVWITSITRWQIQDCTLRCSHAIYYSATQNYPNSNIDVTSLHPYVDVNVFISLLTAPLADCNVERQLYRHGQQFHHPTDSCQLCICTNGTISCRHRPCPSASCSNPITQECWALW